MTEAFQQAVYMLAELMNYKIAINSIIISLFLLAVSFISIKVYGSYRTSLSKPSAATKNIQAGNAQVLGDCENQNDYFTILQDGLSVFAVIAGGLTDKTTGKYAAVISTEILKDEYKKGLHKKQGAKIFFLSCFEKINKRLNDNIYGNKVGASVIAAIIEDSAVQYASAGDCSLFLLRGGELISLNDIKSAEIQVLRFELHKNDILMLSSGGVRESLTEMEILWHLSQENHPYRKCQNLAGLIRTKTLPHRGNATIIVAEM